MEKKHPSYGILRITRSSVGGEGKAIFGSSIMHNNVIRLSISHGMMERSGNEDRFYAKELMKDRIVEVEMSYTQFAEAITSFNMGAGVPVTLTNIGGEFLPACPYENRQKIMKQEVQDATKEIVEKLDKWSGEVEKILTEKRSLSKEDRSNIISILKSMKQELNLNIPFLNEMFIEQMDKTVTEAKGEFESYLQNKMNSIALAAMTEQAAKCELEMNKNMIPELSEEEQLSEKEQETEMQMNM